MANEAYTSHNTNRLDVDGTVKKILTTDYVNGVIGVRYTSRKNPDNSIFMPETGFWNNQYSATQDREHIGIGRYWSSSSSVNGGNTISFANTLECHDGVSTNNGSYYRYCGLAVRGVCE